VAEASFRETLVASAVELSFDAEAFRPLDDAEAAQIAAAVEERFGDAANGGMVGWWHSDRPCPVPSAAKCFHDGGWRYLTAVAPGAAPVWLLAENWDGGQPRLFVFASTAGVVKEVLGNTHGFEYIVVGRQFDWLFAEDHHDCVYVAGTGAVEELQAINPEPS
jgi:uncharacterized protein DUF6756